MNTEIISATKGDSKDTIDSLIEYLKECKSKGATHYKMRWSGDPMWAFKWFETFRIKSDEEVRQEKIASLKEELKGLEEE